MREIDFKLRGDHITLDALLKATGLAESGGRAKAMVGSGQVQVDGQLELRKACKLRAGQRVSLTDARVRVHASENATETAAEHPPQGHAACQTGIGQTRSP